MSVLTEAFDEWLEIVNFHHAQVRPETELVANPGASNEDIKTLEQKLGFPLAPEAQALYQHANGIRHPSPRFLPWSLRFWSTSMHEQDTLSSRDWVEGCRVEAAADEWGALGPNGLPIHAFPIFVGQQAFMYVECSEPWSGLMSFLNLDGFQWISRTLTGFFQANVEAYHDGILVWDDLLEDFMINSRTFASGSTGAQIGDPIDPNDRGPYLWRWSRWRGESKHL